MFGGPRVDRLVGCDRTVEEELQGAARALAASFAPTERGAPPAPERVTQSDGGVIVDARRVTTRILRDALGDDRLRELRERGASMDTDAAVAFTIARLQTYLSRASG